MIALNERHTQSILIVNDSTINLVLMRKILASQGYQVELAGSVQSVRLQVTKAIPDLIVLNLMMSTVDGVEVTSYLRQEPKLAHIPILLLSDDSYLYCGQMNGIEANSVIHKPFELEILLLSINNLLKAKNDREKNNDRQQIENVNLFHQTTILLDLNQDDPLHQEQQELEAIQNNHPEAIFWQALSTRGYEVVHCSDNNL